MTAISATTAAPMRLSALLPAPSATASTSSSPSACTAIASSRCAARWPCDRPRTLAPSSCHAACDCASNIGSAAQRATRPASSDPFNEAGHHAHSGSRAIHTAGTGIASAADTGASSIVSATRQGMIVMPGGGGGSVIAPPSPTEPTLALVVFTLADTNLKNARNASGDMSRIWITVSVVSRSATRSA